MVVFPNCKINLGLHVIGKRVDGYHDLETVFYPLQINDALEIIEQENVQGRLPDVQFTASGLPSGNDIENNLCVKAYRLLKKDFSHLPPVKIHLHKTIPVGAGLGGGSADGAFTLQLLNRKFNLNIPEKHLTGYCLQLGSDCPFFITNKPAFATGRGEILEETAIDLSGYKVMIVDPRIHISTAWAFANINPCKRTGPIRKIITQPIETWKHELRNDFEEPVFFKYPEIKKIKDELENSGAMYASMSGSGSVVYGIFEKQKQPGISFPPGYLIRILNC